ncbi:MAG: nucleotidyl transferase AbiEii/AbiGii toxin family protein [Elusimicrobia bacterium]|nr:nucleotidyl transferase AbiEii/AbiGii toxin family protein [Elusimicrobiota bacterium]
MNNKVHEIQLRVLEIFSKTSKTFALAGGTALELFYLKHRFSRDLDFFSPNYTVKEIQNIVSQIKSGLKLQVKFENEFSAAGHGSGYISKKIRYFENA